VSRGLATVTRMNRTTSSEDLAERLEHFLERTADLEIPPMLIEGLLPGDGIALLHGQPRDGKSFVALEMLVALATGSPAFGLLRVPRAIAAWYLAEEDSPARVRQRIQALLRGRGVPLPPANIHVSVREGINLDDRRWQDRLIEETTARRIRYVFIDTLRSTTAGADQGPSELREVAVFLRRWIRETGIGMAIVHHDIKPPTKQGRPHHQRAQRASGGGVFSIADSPISFERIDDRRTRLVPNSYKFMPDPSPLVITLETDNPERPSWFRLLADLDTGPTASVSLIANIRQFIEQNPGASMNKIAMTVGGNKANTLGAIRGLIEEGAIRVAGGKGGARLCWLSD
jgi:hypothetical protein